jgi:hypothetical protein
MQPHFIGETGMAKIKAARKKSAKRSKVVKPRGAKPVKPRRPAKGPQKSRPPKSKTQEPVYGPSFFLTAVSDTAPAYEFDGTPHPITIQCYRLGNADIKEFEEQDGTILYKVIPLKTPVGR